MHSFHRLEKDTKMEYLKNTKKEVEIGDIFMIPLFLPWREREDLIDYKRYQFRKDDLYAFGRLIDIDMGNCKLIEVFQYVGKIPDTPEIIVNSGRLFAPVFVVQAFRTSRWRVLFGNPYYDKRIDSDYENILFLYPVCTMRLWKGGKDIRITPQQRDEMIQAGVQGTVINGGAEIENDIRSLLIRQGLELNYEKIVEERQNEYPKPRDMDRKLKQTIAPFRWLSECGRYSLILDAGILNQALFEKNNWLGNGYDWEKIALAFMENFKTDPKAKFTFDCEADMFSMQSSSKKALKEFALAFHKFVMNAEAFDKLLNKVK